MSKNGKMAIATAAGTVYAGFTIGYFRETVFGTVLSSILFVGVLYPVFRIWGFADDRWFLQSAAIFVPLATLLNYLKPFVPLPFVQLSTVGILLAAFGGMVVAEPFKRKQSPSRKNTCRQ